MRDNEMIEFKGDCTMHGLYDELWCEAKDKWRDADFETRCAVWDRIKEWCDAVSDGGSELPSITQINDIIWFECDDLFYPPVYKVEAFQYDEETGTVGDSIPELTKEFSGLSGRTDAEEYGNEINADDRRVTLTNSDSGEVERDW